MKPEEETFLGLDLSTQKLKAVQLSSQTLEVIAHVEVKFDTDFQEYRTVGGVNAGLNKNEFFVNPVMWVKALEMVLNKLMAEQADLSTVKAISGSAQQHGSVYWSQQGIETLQDLKPDQFLHTQIDESAFTQIKTPIWMDNSTKKQCIEMEEAVGGKRLMYLETGSKCYERFTGPQIRKIYQSKTDIYEKTSNISLVSSFLASLFLGKIAPIDFCDACGMNLFDVAGKKFSERCLSVCAPDLGMKLGDPVPSNRIIGTVCPFFVDRFNFPADCKILAFTGDNLSAMAGMIVGKNWLTLSLGTSDTVMVSLDVVPDIEEGHIFIHPTIPDHFMGMLCFRNGSLVRDIFKRAEANDSWDYFSELLNSTPRGNFGNMAVHLVNQEIIPNLKGSLRWNEKNVAVAKFNSPQAEIRALVEGQMIHRKAMAADMGFRFKEDSRILVTGGASSNKAILQVMADVFNCSVYVQNNSEGALFGAAFRAKYGIYSAETQSPEPYEEYMLKMLPNHMHRVCDPSQDSDKIYTPMVERYRKMLLALAEQQQA